MSTRLAPRLGYLIGLNVLIWTTWIHLLVKPPNSQTAQPEGFWPRTIQLANGQQMQATHVPASPHRPKTSYDRLWSHQRYIWQQGKRQLLLDLRYIGNTNGNISTFQSTFLDPHFAPLTPIAPQIQSSAMGFYRLSAQPPIQFLDSCLNPNGPATVTATQFTQNRYRYDLQLPRLMAWGLGQSPLLDKRCIWIRLQFNGPGHHTLTQLWPLISQQLQPLLTHPF